MASKSPTKTGPARKRLAQGDGRKGTLARGRLNLIDPKRLTTRQLIGIHVFGLCTPRLGACDDIADPTARRMIRDTDRALKRNEKAQGAFEHREQLGWVFRQLVKTADALGVPVSNQRALKALRARLEHDPVADAMLTVVWISTLIPRTAEDNERLHRDTLREAVARCRAINAGGEYRSAREKALAARLRAQFAPTREAA